MVAFSHSAAEEYGKESEDINFAKIQMSMDSKMEFIARRVQATDVITLISGDNNFRHTIDPNYKANRDGVWRPENLKNAKAYLMANWDGLIVDGLEADDVIACMARYHYELELGKRGKVRKMIFKGLQDQYDEVYIATLDKDMGQITKSSPELNSAKIFMYRWETQHQGEKITPLEGFGELKCIIKQSGKNKKKEIKGYGPKFFLWQLLTGDSTDGIMGCGVSEKRIYKTGAKAGQEYEKRVGIGAVEAYELLANVANYSEGLKVVINQYILRFAEDWEKMLLLNGRMLYMATRVYEDNTVNMWHYNPSIKDRISLKTLEFIPASS